LHSAVLPLLHQKSRRIVPVSEMTRVRKRHKVTFLILASKRDDVVAWLTGHDWHPVRDKTKQVPEPAPVAEPDATAGSPD
ncbi:MAG: hypothetical protein Q8N51_14195, partial [Gammaproteobacteria bacterium]|nr:hypothetical protein [Gammaproteobacteria bacterium]